jgi:DNA-directed RNA polymerase specialized sigma24 family protein
MPLPPDQFVAAEEFEARRSALAACLDELPRRNRELLADYYGKGRSLGDTG